MGRTDRRLVLGHHIGYQAWRSFIRFKSTNRVFKVWCLVIVRPSHSQILSLSPMPPSSSKTPYPTTKHHTPTIDRTPRTGPWLSPDFAPLLPRARLCPSSTRPRASAALRPRPSSAPLPVSSPGRRPAALPLAACAGSRSRRPGGLGLRPSTRDSESAAGCAPSATGCGSTC